MRYLALLALITTSAAADSLVVNLASYHFSDRTKNEKNFGLGYRRPTSVALCPIAEAGFYDNSNDDWSFYGACSTETARPYYNVGLLYGAATGYKRHGIEKITGVLLPYLSIGKNHRANIGIVPIKKGGLTFRYEYKF